MGYKIVGNTVVEWKDDELFAITMKEKTGPKDDRREKIIKIDNSHLRRRWRNIMTYHADLHGFDGKREA